MCVGVCVRVPAPVVVCVVTRVYVMACMSVGVCVVVAHDIYSPESLNAYEVARGTPIGQFLALPPAPAASA